MKIIVELLRIEKQRKLKGVQTMKEIEEFYGK
jgi:hypothetical protein